MLSDRTAFAHSLCGVPAFCPDCIRRVAARCQSFGLPRAGMWLAHDQRVCRGGGGGEPYWRKGRLEIFARARIGLGVTAEWRPLAPSRAGIIPSNKKPARAGCTSASLSSERFGRREAGVRYESQETCQSSGRRGAAPERAMLVLRLRYGSAPDAEGIAAWSPLYGGAPPAAGRRRRPTSLPLAGPATRAGIGPRSHSTRRLIGGGSKVVGRETGAEQRGERRQETPADHLPRHDGVSDGAGEF